MEDLPISEFQKYSCALTEFSQMDISWYLLIR